MSIPYARALRKKSTFAERQLWYFLKDRRLAGYKFRRQHCIGRYIVDFVCLRTKLVLELDGPHHIDQQQYDAVRDAWLRKEGFRVLRIRNEEFLGGRGDEFIKAIVNTLKEGS